MISNVIISYLPYSYAGCCFGEWASVRVGEFKSVHSDLEDVVHEGAESGQGEEGGKKDDVAQLDEHFQVVVEQVLKFMLHSNQ